MAPGASPDMSGLSAPSTVPCMPKIGTTAIGAPSWPSTRMSASQSSSRLPPASSSFSPRRSRVTASSRSNSRSSRTPMRAGRRASSAASATATSWSSNGSRTCRRRTPPPTASFGSAENCMGVACEWVVANTTLPA